MPPFQGKSSELIPLGDDLNFSTPLARVAHGTVVPTELFFLRSNNPVPRIDPAAWRLQIEGRVRKPHSVGLADLQSMPSTTHEVWLECAGNSRRRWNPAAEGNQWDDQAVSNAAFTGVPLRDLLDQTGVESDAIELVTTGADADSHTESGVFQRGLPLETALRPSTMLVWQMNGQPIPVANGGPVRLIVPGWAGIASVKWPVRMELVNEPFKGYYNAQRYIIVDRDGPVVRSVREMPVKSVIAAPADGAQVPASGMTIFGFAWSGFGPIEGVDVSVDDQQTWSPARLVHGSGSLAWTRWEYTWQPSGRGTARISSRATDSAGNTQPAANTWNKFGYQLNAIPSREVRIG